jgi:hypothetical protein
LFAYFSVVLGGWTQGCAPARQVVLMLLCQLLLVIFEIGSQFLPRSAWTANLLFYASYHNWEDRCTPSFFCWDGVLWTFSSELAWNHSPLNLSLSWGWDDRCEPPMPGLTYRAFKIITNPNICHHKVGCARWRPLFTHNVELSEQEKR